MGKPRKLSKDSTGSSPRSSTEEDKVDESGTSTRITLVSHKGDIFSAPENTVLIHACNTQGIWGSGIAQVFKEHYPCAYQVYRKHCLVAHSVKNDPVETGTCLLIPPCETDSKRAKHWIACLFTSAKFGKAKDKPDIILENTEPAMRELLEMIREKEEDEGESIAGLWMCKINSAKFGVPWQHTLGVLESIDVQEGWRRIINVWSRDDEDED